MNKYDMKAMERERERERETERQRDRERERIISKNGEMHCLLVTHFLRVSPSPFDPQIPRCFQKRKPT